ncbi:MAG: hypothetical protein NZ602_16445 [Thermoguttaceae bacterium]|nr:hypothetical protein [Thermoguttaceae bacterium]MDW8038370.1 hypothetical protein [Thermoguttaceae bacterium]
MKIPRKGKQPVRKPATRFAHLQKRLRRQRPPSPPLPKKYGK